LAVYYILLLAATSAASASPEDLELVRNAQQAALSLYPSGKLKARSTLREIRNRELDHEHSVLAEVTWMPDATFLACTETMRRGSEMPRSARRQYLQVSGVLASHFPETPSVLISRETRTGLHPDLLLRPEQRWFTYQDQRTWLSCLSMPISETVSYIATRHGDDVDVVIETMDIPDVPTRCEATFSFALRGMATKASLAMPAGKGREWTLRCDSSWEWGALADGRPVLRRSKYKMASELKGDTRATEYELEVLEFDPDAKIPDSRFELASLGIEPGTMVEESGPNGLIRRYKWGQDPTDAEGKLRLNKLAEELKGKGFAEPARP
jgi:hypothetical protein